MVECQPLLKPFCMLGPADVRIVKKDCGGLNEIIEGACLVNWTLNQEVQQQRPKEGLDSNDSCGRLASFGDSGKRFSAWW